MDLERTFLGAEIAYRREQVERLRRPRAEAPRAGRRRRRALTSRGV